MRFPYKVIEITKTFIIDFHADINECLIGSIFVTNCIMKSYVNA